MCKTQNAVLSLTQENAVDLHSEVVVLLTIATTVCGKTQ